MSEPVDMTDIGRIKAKLEELPEVSKAIGYNLYEKLEFMNDTLGKLQASIEANGVTEKYVKNYSTYLRESPAVKTYNTMLQKYCILTKRILELFPKEDIKQDSELQEFLSATDD